AAVPATGRGRGRGGAARPPAEPHRLSGADDPAALGERHPADQQPGAQPDGARHDRHAGHRPAAEAATDQPHATPHRPAGHVHHDHRHWPQAGGQGDHDAQRDGLRHGRGEAEGRGEPGQPAGGPADRGGRRGALSPSPVRLRRAAPDTERKPTHRHGSTPYADDALGQPATSDAGPDYGPGRRDASDAGNQDELTRRRASTPNTEREPTHRRRAALTPITSPAPLRRSTPNTDREPASRAGSPTHALWRITLATITLAL